VKLIIEKDFT